MKFLETRDHLSDKTRIGYENSLNRTNIDKIDMEDEAISRNYANALRNGINKQKGV
jgi:hypothetical protein